MSDYDLTPASPVDIVPTDTPDTSVAAAPAAPTQPAPLDGQWDKARRYVQAATLFQRASLAAQIMAGMELVALHKAWGVQRGGNRRSNPHSGGLTWEDAIKEALGVPSTTAARWMEMAKAARPRLAKSDLELGAILEKSPSALTPAEQELLQVAVHKISDGQTQLEFLLECGVTRGGGQRGGARTRAPGTPEPTAAEQRATWLAAARSNALTAFEGIHSLGERWKLLDDLQLQLALKECRALTAQLDAWLKTEPIRRARLDVEAVFAAAAANAAAVAPATVSSTRITSA